MRYPGLIGYKSDPGGGTTDYAVHIFHEAIEKGSYECFLSENTYLPMMYMPDAIRATIGIMEQDAANIKIRSSYNLSGMSFSPKELAAEIKTHLPAFSISYKHKFERKSEQTDIITDALTCKTYPKYQTFNQDEKRSGSTVR